MTFFQAINTCINKYIIFEGRAKRTEYWYWRLFQVSLARISDRLDVFYFNGYEHTLNFGPFQLLIGPLAIIVLFLTYIPTISVSVRRLHDINKSGWWLLISLTGIGIFILIYWHLLPSDKAHKKNNYREIR